MRLKEGLRRPEEVREVGNTGSPNTNPTKVEACFKPIELELATS